MTGEAKAPAYAGTVMLLRIRTGLLSMLGSTIGLNDAQKILYVVAVS